jgi:hypothetical protein
LQMKMSVGRLVMAIVLFVAGFACWAEARLARRVAEAHQRLATLHYDETDAVDEAMTPIDRLPWPMGSLQSDIQVHRARVQYWRSRGHAPAQTGSGQQPLSPSGTPESTRTAAGSDVRNPEEMFITTNTAFRAAQSLVDRAVAVVRLDAVIESYAEVLRRDAGNVDAAFNYEFAARYRDTLARGRGPIRPNEGKPADDEAATALDLPAGPTIHGRPGAPPPELPGEQFKTLVPVPADEEQETPGEGTPRRKG